MRAMVVLALLLLLPAAGHRLFASDQPAAAVPSCPAGVARVQGDLVCTKAPDPGVPALAAWWMGRPLDLNEVGASDLTVVPGIGAKLAARIVQDRQERGPYATVAAVQRVRGIGPVLAARLAEYAAVYSSDQRSKVSTGSSNR